MLPAFICSTSISASSAAVRSAAGFIRPSSATARQVVPTAYHRLWPRREAGLCERSEIGIIFPVGRTRASRSSGSRSPASAPTRPREPVISAPQVVVSCETSRRVLLGSLPLAGRRGLDNGSRNGQAHTHPSSLAEKNGSKISFGHRADSGPVSERTLPNLSTRALTTVSVDP